MFHRFCISLQALSQQAFLSSLLWVVLDNGKLALFENPKVEQTEMSSKCLCWIINLIQSHMEFHVQKKLIKDNNINLVAVGFAFIGKMIKADEFFVQDSLDKYYSTCDLLFQSLNFPIGVTFISNGETL